MPRMSLSLSDLSDDDGDDDAAPPSILETTSWINDHKYSAIKVPTEIVDMPPSDVASRVQYPHHISDLEAKMKIHQDFSRCCEVYFSWPERKALPPHTKGTLSPLDDLHQEYLTQSPHVNNRWVVCGAHRVSAWKNLKNRFQKNKNYKFVNAWAIIAPDTPEARRYLQAWGDLDNQKNTSLPTSFADNLRRCRQEFESFERLVRIGKIKSKDVVERRKQAKEFFQDVTGIRGGTFIQLWTIATKPEAIYKRIKKICVGDVQPPKYSKGKGKKRPVYKKPKSASNFVHIGNVDERHLCKWMDKIIAGDKPPSWLPDECKMFKARRRVMREIANTLATLSGSEVKALPWDECKSNFPECSSQSKIKVWGSTIYSMKLIDRAPMPKKFFAWLKGAYARDMKDRTNRQHAKSLQRVTYVCCSFLLLCVNLPYILFSVQFICYSVFRCMQIKNSDRKFVFDFANGQNVSGYLCDFCYLSDFLQALTDDYGNSNSDLLDCECGL